MTKWTFFYTILFYSTDILQCLIDICTIVKQILQEVDWLLSRKGLFNLRLKWEFPLGWEKMFTV